MRFNKGEMVNFLEFLEQKYPDKFDTLENLKRTAPAAINKENIMAHLLFFWEGKYINATPLVGRGEPVAFKDIRINSKGIEYLLNLRRT